MVVVPMVVVVMPVVPMMMMPMVPVMMVPMVMMPVVMVMPMDPYGLQAIDLVLTNHGGFCAIRARRHQGLLR